MVQPVTLSRKDLEAAHKHSSCHRDELLRSDMCGCFYCLATFAPSEIQEWIEEPAQMTGASASRETALCPRCGIDSVIGTASGIQMTPPFLQQMQQYWF